MLSRAIWIKRKKALVLRTRAVLIVFTRACFIQIALETIKMKEMDAKCWQSRPC